MFCHYFDLNMLQAECPPILSLPRLVTVWLLLTFIILLKYGYSKELKNNGIIFSTRHLFFKVRGSKMKMRSSHCGAVETNLTRNDEVAGWIPGLAQWVKDPVLP